MTRPAQAARARRLVLPALVAALALGLSACAMGPEVFGQGGPDPDSSASPYPGGIGDESTNHNPDGEPGTGGEAPRPVVGTIEVKLENAPNPHSIFRMEASECEVSRDRVWAVGVGAELTTGVTASLTVATELNYVLHEPSGTFHAQGAIVLEIVGGGVWTSDGRLKTTADVTLPSMFDYRVEEDYGEFRTEWFEAGGAEGAGFVHIWCE